MKKIRLSLRAARTQAGFTIEEASSKLHISKPTLIKYEQGSVTPRVNVAIEMAKLYGFKLDQINFNYTV